MYKVQGYDAFFHKENEMNVIDEWQYSFYV